jgi:hypothetical protein
MCAAYANLGRILAEVRRHALAAGLGPTPPTRAQLPAGTCLPAGLANPRTWDNPLRQEATAKAPLVTPSRFCLDVPDQ